MHERVARGFCGRAGACRTGVCARLRASLPGSPGSATACSRRSATAGMTSSTTTSICATRPRRRRRGSMARSVAGGRHAVVVALESGLRRRLGRKVTVNGLPAKFTRDGEELVITPRLPLLKGLPFVVQVPHYTARPIEPGPERPAGGAVLHHPRRLGDRRPARRHARLLAVQRPSARQGDVHDPLRRAGRGARVRQRRAPAKSTSGGRTHYVYLMRQPMATELIQLAVGSYQDDQPRRHTASRSAT